MLKVFVLIHEYPQEGTGLESVHATYDSAEKEKQLIALERGIDPDEFCIDEEAVLS